MPDTLDEIEIDADLAGRLRDAQQAYDEVREYLEALKDEIKARYADHERLVATHAGEQIFVYSRYETTRINSSRLKRDWPDIYNQYLVTSTSQRVSVVRQVTS